MYITQSLLVQYAARIIKLFVFLIVQGVPKNVLIEQNHNQN